MYTFRQIICLDVIFFSQWQNLMQVHAVRTFPSISWSSWCNSSSYRSARHAWRSSSISAATAVPPRCTPWLMSLATVDGPSSWKQTRCMFSSWMTHGSGDLAFLHTFATFHWPMGGGGHELSCCTGLRLPMAFLTEYRRLRRSIFLASYTLAGMHCSWSAPPAYLVSWRRPWPSKPPLSQRRTSMRAGMTLQLLRGNKRASIWTRIETPRHQGRNQSPDQKAGGPSSPPSSPPCSRPEDENTRCEADTSCSGAGAAYEEQQPLALHSCHLVIPRRCRWSRRSWSISSPWSRISSLVTLGVCILSF
jgi:hypothetical protein